MPKASPNLSKLTSLLLGTFIVTNIIVDVADSVNTTGDPILATMVAVGKYILMVVVILFAVKQVE